MHLRRNHWTRCCLLHLISQAYSLMNFGMLRWSKSHGINSMNEMGMQMVWPWFWRHKCILFFILCWSVLPLILKSNCISINWFVSLGPLSRNWSWGLGLLTLASPSKRKFKQSYTILKISRKPLLPRREIKFEICSKLILTHLGLA